MKNKMAEQKMLKKLAVVFVLLVAVVFIAGCTGGPSPTISDNVTTPEYAQDSSQADQSVNDFYAEAYSTSPADLPDY